MTQEKLPAQNIFDKIKKKDDNAPPKQTCVYPNCNKAPTMMAKLLQDPPKKIVEGKEVNAAEVPCCKYHYFILMNGSFRVDVKSTTEVDIKGPMPQISLIESVMAAREMTKKEMENVKFGIRPKST